MEKSLPDFIPNRVGGRDVPAAAGREFEKRDPATGRILCRAARSDGEDVERAVAAARAAQRAWGELPGVKRGEILYEAAFALKRRREEIAKAAALETGKSLAAALAETDGAAALGLFMAGEGQRFYGRTTTSSVPNRRAMTVREPLGVAGLIVPANTPVANAAWKVFPALACGNGAVLKAAEDAPATPCIFGRILEEAGVPPGVLNIVQGFGAEAGEPIVLHPGVAVISFTGSTAAGRRIAALAGERLARVSLELGGKNPFVVCDDADLENAARWAALSAFSNAGQRCASGSRILVQESVYAKFRDALLERTRGLRLGTSDRDDLGPVINERALNRILEALEKARRGGARVLAGGRRAEDPALREGYYLVPTLVEGAGPADEISTAELFGPVACLCPFRTFDEAIALANDSPYGLAACVHTRSVHRAMEFVRRIQAGVAVVNAGTHGSEPHMPFGGVKQSGNGSREPGTEALDVYSNLKDVYIVSDPAGV